jgi:polyhydroxybutyrate depolymerase
MVSTSIRTGGFDRDYLIHIPAGYNCSRELPMVVVIHGGFDTGKGMEKFSGFSDLADRENFIVLYPNGIGILGFLQHWNAGHCCGRAQSDHIDDVGFLAAVIDSACRRFHVDRRRIFMLGFSNGGMMTYRFASERGEMLAGAAALAASIGSRTEDAQEAWPIPVPVKPIPFLIMHGTADAIVPPDGRVSLHHGEPRFYRSVSESVKFWRFVNGCSDEELTQSLFDGAVRLTKWRGCSSSKPVWLYILRGWDHRWPGTYFTSQSKDGNPLKGFDAAEIIWEFFKSACRSSQD